MMRYCNDEIIELYLQQISIKDSRICKELKKAFGAHFFFFKLEHSSLMVNLFLCMSCCFGIFWQPHVCC
jgi:hypothetical protein